VIYPAIQEKLNQYDDFVVVTEFTPLCKPLNFVFAGRRDFFSLHQRYSEEAPGTVHRSEGEKISMTMRAGSATDRLDRHQNLVSTGERGVSFCPLTR
jgi:hypothetical protein